MSRILVQLSSREELRSSHAQLWGIVAMTQHQSPWGLKVTGGFNIPPQKGHSSGIFMGLPLLHLLLTPPPYRQAGSRSPVVSPQHQQPSWDISPISAAPIPLCPPPSPALAASTWLMMSGFGGGHRQVGKESSNKPGNKNHQHNVLRWDGQGPPW